MSFEMSLPHPPRIQSLAADGTEALAHDEQQWQLYYTVQSTLQHESEGGEQAEGADAAEGDAPAAATTQPADPGKVLEKLLAARGELAVIADLITFVEQQQFLSVEGVHRHPPTLEQRLRTRSLRLAAARAALGLAGERLAAGAAALRARAEADNRFLADLAALRARWVLRRHAGAGGLFYADLSLPLRGTDAAAAAQEGANCNVIQDTNGDACIVESDSGGKRRAVRGAARIHAVLQLKQRLLAWRALQQLVATAAAAPEHQADADRSVAAVEQLLASAAEGCQAALRREVAGGGRGAAATADGMEVDSGPEPQQQQQQQQQQEQERQQRQAAFPAALPPSMLSSTAQDIQAALALPGFQQRFEAEALQQLAAQLPGGGGGGGRRASGGGSSSPAAVLDGLLRWLRHAATSHRVAASLQRWQRQRPGRQLGSVDSGEEFAAVWRLHSAGEAPGALPLLAVVQGGKVRLEGGDGRLEALQPAAAGQRGLTRAELDGVLLSL